MKNHSFIILVLVLVTGCNNRITIETNPTNARIVVDDKIYHSPARICIKPDQYYHISHIGFIDQNILGQDLLDQRETEISIELQEILHRLSLYGHNSNGIIVKENGIILEEPLLLSEGSHTLQFSKENYYSQERTVTIDNDISISVNLRRKCRFINIPNNFLSFELEEITYSINDYFPFPLQDNIPLVINTADNNYELRLIESDASFSSNNEIDLSVLFNKHSQINPTTSNNIVDIQASWIEKEDRLFSMRIYEPIYIHQDPYFMSETPEENTILLYFNGLYIGNPQEDIIGGNIIVTMKDEKKSYEISQDLFTDNLIIYDLYDNPWEESTGIATMLQIDSYDFNYPYNNASINVHLLNDGIIMDQVNLNYSGSYLGADDFHLYDHPRDRFFDNETQNLQEKSYLYINPELSNGYIVIFKEEKSNRGNYIPIQIFSIKEITSDPAILTVSGDFEENMNYLLHVTKDIYNLNDWSFYDFETIE